MMTGGTHGCEATCAAIVAVIVAVMAALTWVIPPGSYDYHEVDVNGRMRSIAIDGTFHYLPESEANPTGPLVYFASPSTGCVDAADSIFVIFVCAGTFGILVKTGAFHAGIGTVLCRMGGKDVLLVPILMSVFALGSSMFGMLSEFYGFIPLQKWWRWFLPLASILFLLQMALIALAMALGMSRRGPRCCIVTQVAPTRPPCYR